MARNSRHNSLFQLFWLSPGPGERSLIAGGRAASSLNFATTFATCTFNPSCFLALPSISQSHSLPHFATPSPVCDIRQAQRWWGCKNQWIEKSPVHAGLILLLIYPLQKLLPWIWWGRIIFSPSKISCSYRKCNLGGVFEGGFLCPLSPAFVKKSNPCF